MREQLENPPPAPEPLPRPEFGKLELEIREDGFKWALILKDGDRKLFRKDYWLGQNGNGEQLEPDRVFLEALIERVNNGITA